MFIFARYLEVHDIYKRAVFIHMQYLYARCVYVRSIDCANGIYTHMAFVGARYVMGLYRFACLLVTLSVLTVASSFPPPECANFLLTTQNIS